MSPANRSVNIAEELSHADEALRAAEALIGLSLFRDAANRLYGWKCTRAWAGLLESVYEEALQHGIGV